MIAQTKVAFRMKIEIPYQWKSGCAHIGVPVGTKFEVVSWSPSGEVRCVFPKGRRCTLGTADIVPSGDWPADELAGFKALPKVSLLRGFDIQNSAMAAP